MEQANEANTKNIDEEKLKLERQRLAIETRLKRKEQQFQRQQFDASRKGFTAWAQVITPVGAATIAGIVGLFGVVWNGYQSNLIETKKQQGNVILEAIKTAGPEKEKQASANLLFFAEAGIINLPPDKIDLIKAKAGDRLPSLLETHGFFSKSPHISYDDPDEGTALKVKNGKLLVLKGSMGIAVVKIDHLGSCRARYRWRYDSQEGTGESFGSGELFEQYGRRADDENSVTDLGSKLLIQAGPYKVERSCASADSGWIYAYKAQPTLEAFSADGVFEDFYLKGGQ